MYAKVNYTESNPNFEIHGIDISDAKVINFNFETEFKNFNKGDACWLLFAVGESDYCFGKDIQFIEIYHNRIDATENQTKLVDHAKNIIANFTTNADYPDAIINDCNGNQKDISYKFADVPNYIEIIECMIGGQQLRQHIY